MAIYLLDTSVLIDTINEKRGRRQLLVSLLEAGDTLGCSVVTIGEIYAGMRPRESAMTQLLLDELEHYGIDANLARHAGLLKNEWARKGQTLSLNDMLIAATALAYNLPLMTDNRKDFPMPQLSLYPLP